MYHRSLLVALAMLFSGTHVVYAKSTYSVTCPASITSTEAISDVPAAWQAWQGDHAHHWQAVNFYDGHPKEMASLAPAKSNKQSATWQFDGARDIYVSCGYYRSGVELIQVLSKKIKSCVVMYDAMSYGEQGLVAKKIICSD